jgi:hypothetical protein
VQTDGQLSSAGGSLVIPAQSSPTWGDLGLHGDARTRAPGLCLYWPLTLSTWEELGVGWHDAAAVVDPDSMEHALQANTTNGRLDDENGNAVVTGLSTSTEYKLLQILRDVGCFYVLDGKLTRVSDTGDTSTLYPVLANLDGVGTLEDAHVSSLPAPWSDGDWTEVTGLDSSPAETEEIARPAGSALIDLGDITLPGSVAMHIDIRYVDSNNFARLYIAADGSAEIKETIGGSEGSALGSVAPGGITDSAGLLVEDVAGEVRVISALVDAFAVTLTDHSEAVKVRVTSLGS